MNELAKTDTDFTMSPCLTFQTPEKKTLKKGALTNKEPKIGGRRI